MLLYRFPRVSYSVHFTLLKSALVEQIYIILIAEYFILRACPALSLVTHDIIFYRLNRIVYTYPVTMVGTQVKWLSNPYCLLFNSFCHC